MTSDAPPRSGITVLQWLEQHWVLLTAALVPPWLAVLILMPGEWRVGAAWLAWAHPLVYFLHQIEEHGWPGGFKRFANQRVFGCHDRDWPFNDRVLLLVNVPLTWVLFPLAALLLDQAPVLAAGCFAISLLNGVLHVVMMIPFRGPNPGVWSGATLLVPVGWAGLVSVADRMTTPGWIAAGVMAVAGHGLIVSYVRVRLWQARAAARRH